MPTPSQKDRSAAYRRRAIADGARRVSVLLKRPAVADLRALRAAGAKDDTVAITEALRAAALATESS